MTRKNPKTYSELLQENAELRYQVLDHIEVLDAWIADYVKRRSGRSHSSLLARSRVIRINSLGLLKR